MSDPQSATLSLLAAMVADGCPCASATVIHTSGSIPTEIGSKILVGPGGVRLAGTVGGGLLEAVVLREAGKSLEEGNSRLFSYALTEAEAGGLGMACGGNLQVFIEVFQPSPKLVLVGGGHVNLALYKLALQFGYRLAVVDDRPEWASPENYPEAEILNMRPSDAFNHLNLGASSAVVIATRGHRHDFEALLAALDTPARYIGMIGSKRKVLEGMKELGEQRDLSPDLPRIFAPIGLDLGGKAPLEVALSILSELQMVRHGRVGRPLRESLPTS